MAGESKGDNKLFQMIIIVVTTIIAPVSVYFITHTVQVPTNAMASPTSTLSSPVGLVSITASPDLSLFTPTVELTRTMTAQPQFTTTPEGTTNPAKYNPQGTLLPGDLGIVNGIAVSVVSDEVQLKDRVASIQIHIRNLSNQPQTFSYRMQAITVKDTSERALEVIYGEKRDACSKKDLSAERKIELAPDQEIILQSVGANIDMNWCAAEDSRFLPLYQVSTREAPKAIVIQFNGFGPFNGFGFKIDL